MYCGCQLQRSAWDLQVGFCSFKEPRVLFLSESLKTFPKSKEFLLRKWCYMNEMMTFLKQWGTWTVNLGTTTLDYHSHANSVRLAVLFADRPLQMSLQRYPPLHLKIGRDDASHLYLCYALWKFSTFFLTYKNNIIVLSICCPTVHLQVETGLWRFM